MIINVIGIIFCIIIGLVINKYMANKRKKIQVYNNHFENQKKNMVQIKKRINEYILSKKERLE